MVSLCQIAKTNAQLHVLSALLTEAKEKEEEEQEEMAEATWTFRRDPD